MKPLGFSSSEQTLIYLFDYRISSSDSSSSQNASSHSSEESDQEKEKRKKKKKKASSEDSAQQSSSEASDQDQAKDTYDLLRTLWPKDKRPVGLKSRSEVNQHSVDTLLSKSNFNFHFLIFFWKKDKKYYEYIHPWISF